MAYQVVGDVIVVVNSDRNPRNDEWSDYLRNALAVAQDVRAMPFARQLVITNGGMPTPWQQLRVHFAVRSQPEGTRMAVGVITDSVLMRAMLHMSRRSLTVRAFMPAAVSEALSWLNIDPLRAQAIARALPALSGQVGDPNIVRHVIRALEQLIASDAYAAQLERERAKIAAELHAGLGRELSELRDGLTGLLSRAESGQTDELSSLVQRIADAENDLLGIVWALQADDRSWGDVSSYVHGRLRQNFDARCAAIVTGPEDTTIPSPIALHALRIVQEGLRNALAHADATRITLLLTCERDAIRVEIADDGRGIPADHLDRGYGGVHHIRTRAELAGGRAAVSTDANGTRWIVELPLSGGHA